MYINAGRLHIHRAPGTTQKNHGKWCVQPSNKILPMYVISKLDKAIQIFFTIMITTTTYRCLSED